MGGTIFLCPPQEPRFLHRMYTDGQGFPLAVRPVSSAKSKKKEIT
jgi:hypothetical protein